MDGTILGNRVIKSWTKNPDFYSSGITNAAYVVMERAYAPGAQRMASIIARERQVPAALAEIGYRVDFQTLRTGKETAGLSTALRSGRDDKVVASTDLSSPRS